MSRRPCGPPPGEIQIRSVFPHILRSGAISLLLSVALLPRALAAQAAGEPQQVRHEVFAGSELEEYLRYLQIGGAAGLYPWSVRPFSGEEVSALVQGHADAEHPWARRYTFASDSAGESRLSLLRPSAAFYYNSAFPYGSNDGAVWAGRGLTSAIQAGLHARYGPVSLTLAPMLFRAENAALELTDNGMPGRQRFGSAYNPDHIDRPQRFGEDAYLRVDPGQSTLRVAGHGVAVGVSTANQYWGPATRNPIVLGNNAAGFPHVFLGTERPVNVLIGKLHGRAVWGRLDQSEYSAMSPDSAVRLMSGLAIGFLPRGLPGLEIGLARFIHSVWPEQGLDGSYLWRSFATYFQKNTTDPLNQNEKYSSDNQLTSVFARWVAPRSGFEIYGEFGREDANWDFRDFVLEPDTHSAYMLGLRKVWRGKSGGFVAVRGEVLNTQVTNLAAVRAQGPFYRHTGARQGHTQLGQILGAASGFGGGGSIIAVDRYHPGGRYSVSWIRELQYHGGLSREPGSARDVMHSLGAEALIFRGKVDTTIGVTGVYNQNRGLGQSDVFNANGHLRFAVGL